MTISAPLYWSPWSDRWLGAGDAVYLTGASLSAGGSYDWATVAYAAGPPEGRGRLVRS